MFSRFFSRSISSRLPPLLHILRQRKVLFGCFKRKLNNEVKVAQLSGYVAEHSAYHHGEASLQSTIVGMAQDFVGSNNINLLHPSGQFGTRMAGGKDAASPRYIFTRLEKIARAIYPEIDDELLDLQEDDGVQVEPKTYSPVIPMVLVNGAQGIGTGWSTSIPPYNPLDLIDIIKSKIESKSKSSDSDAAVAARKELVPFVRGFKGTIVKDQKNTSKWITSGVAKKTERNTIEITGE